MTNASNDPNDPFVTQSMLDKALSELEDSLENRIVRRVTASVTNSVTQSLTSSLTESLTNSLTNSITESIAEVLYDMMARIDERFDRLEGKVQYAEKRLDGHDQQFGRHDFRLGKLEIVANPPTKLIQSCG
ncbi:MAG: hypothetical protein ABIQ89_03110 [Candidatus Saccharimonadales bacterium]